MATTIHVPDELLARIDQRARELRMSRNRFVLRSLERSLAEETQWSVPFMSALREAAEDHESHQAVDELRESISSRRTSKGPPGL